MKEGNSDFLMILERIDRGLVVERLDEEVKQAVSAVIANGGKATVSVNIEISPNGELGLQATAKIAKKLPQGRFGTSYFFPGEGGRSDNNTATKHATRYHERLNE